MKRICFLSVACLMMYMASSQVPAYYQVHLASKIRQINESEKSMGASGEVFAFITDTHTGANKMTSASLLREISIRTSLERVVFGGDIVQAYGTEAEMYEAVLKHVNSFDSLLSPYARLYNIIGNHDIMIRDKSDSSQTMVYASTDKAKYALIMKRQESYVHFDKKNPLGCYYYFDNPTQKIRYIGLNAFERQIFTATTWTNVMGISPEQASWLSHSALRLPGDDWDVFVFIHAGVSEASYPGGHLSFSVAKDILEAFNAKKAYKFKGESGKYIHDLNIDFSDAKGRIVSVFSGHVHKDLLGYVNSIPHIVTANDASYSNDGIKRVRRTVNESCFDVVCYDRDARLMSLVRVGAGYNRTIHLGRTLVPMTSSVKLTPVKEVVTWEVADPSIAGVKAGLALGKRKGETTVIAIDDVGNKEYFNILVE